MRGSLPKKKETDGDRKKLDEKIVHVEIELNCGISQLAYKYKKTALMILKFFSSLELHEATHCVKSLMSNRSFFELMCRTKNSGKSNSSATVHIIAIQMIARPGRGLYRSGKHIAYHRSIDMNVSVKIDTVTLTVCVNIKQKKGKRCFQNDNTEKTRLEMWSDKERNLIFVNNFGSLVYST